MCIRDSPNFRAMQQEAWKSRAEGDLRVLRLAIESYYRNQGCYPEEDPAGSDTYQDTLIGVQPRILTEKAYDPFRAGQVEYVYRLSLDSTEVGYPDNARYYVLYSYGFDGQRDIKDGTNASGNGPFALPPNDNAQVQDEANRNDDIIVTNGIKPPGYE